MDTYSKFKGDIDEIKEQLDTFLFCLDKKESANNDETVGSLVEHYSNLADWLKRSMEDLAKAEGETLLKDIDYDGKFRS